MPASRHRAARGLRRRCAMPGVARDTRQYTQRTPPYVAALVRTLPLTLTVRLTTFQHASRRFTFGRPRRLYIYKSWLRIPYILLALHLPPAATCARRHLDGNPPHGDRIKPSRAGAQIGVSSRGRGHHAGARRRRTAASSGRPAARHEATKPPPRAHLANELGSLQRAPCFSSSLPRRLSADGGATRPFRRPRHTPKRAQPD